MSRITIDPSYYPRDAAAAAAAAAIDYSTAHRLLGEIRIASSNYGTTVTCCLGGELHNNSYCSGSEDFCQEVYSGVVSLLDRDLENS
jgi:hypothetical protein